MNGNYPGSTQGFSQLRWTCLRPGVTAAIPLHDLSKQQPKDSNTHTELFHFSVHRWQSFSIGRSSNATLIYTQDMSILL